MKKSENTKVQDFLNKIEQNDINKFKILEKLRTIVFKTIPKTEERMMYGGIMFYAEEEIPLFINENKNPVKEDFGGLFVRKQHISFEFGTGYMMEDPDKVLEGTGQFRRHLKIRSLDDITNKSVSFFIQQAI